MPGIVDDLNVALSRQDRVPSAGGGRITEQDKAEDKGLSAIAHTRSPVHWGASQAASDLQDVLTTWARDATDVGFLAQHSTSPARAAARILLNHIDAIRRRPNVAELVDEIADAVAQARRIVDRPADLVFVGPCLVEQEGETCHEDIYARVDATWATCRACGTTHEIAERRAWLLVQARDRLFTVREAAQMLGEVGGIRVTEHGIRGYLRRGRLTYHSPGLIKLGELLDVVAETSKKRSA